MNAPVSLLRTMHHVESSEFVDFADIYEDHVEMVSVTAPLSGQILGATEVVLRHPAFQAQWIQGGDENAQHPAADRPDSLNEALTVLRGDLEVPVEILKELLGCESCGVRVKVLDGPMCPRFHVDRVPCRMLRTYAGPGTEWIAHQDVHWERFADGDPKPTLEGSDIRQLQTGAWSLLKGGTWDSDFGGVVHRSPTREERRLLVTLDPIFMD